jgi:hypothetical protein
MEDPDSPPTPPAVIPPAPVPAYLGLHSTSNERIGALAERRLGIQRDIERISRHALIEPNKNQVADDPDGKIIRHPVMWMATIDRKMRLMDLDLKVHQEVYDVDRVREYLHRMSETIIVRLNETAPEVCAMLLADLEALNAEFNIGGDPGLT